MMERIKVAKVNLSYVLNSDRDTSKLLVSTLKINNENKGISLFCLVAEGVANHHPDSGLNHYYSKEIVHNIVDLTESNLYRSPSTFRAIPCYISKNNCATSLIKCKLDFDKETIKKVKVYNCKISFDDILFIKYYSSSETCILYSTKIEISGKKEKLIPTIRKSIKKKKIL